jgi:hypothetical protein
MNKIFLTLIICAAFTVTSCKKDRTCTCTMTSTEPGSTSMTYEVVAMKAKKSDVKKVCVKTTRDVASGGVIYTETSDCKLK